MGARPSRFSRILSLGDKSSGFRLKDGMTEGMMKGATLPTETVFVLETSPIKFGLGATDELGHDARRLGMRRALIITDRNLMALGHPERVRGLLDEEGVKAEIFDGVHIEPTDRSIEEAVRFVGGGSFDGFVAVGGGSAIDTAKAVNLLISYPEPLLDYINKPIGGGVPVPGPLKSLIAVPTTAGTGSETTAVAVVHLTDLRVKAGISHRLLRPTLGVVDPLNTLTAPPRGHCRGRRRHPHPRPRVLHYPPLGCSAQAPPRGAAHLPRCQPDQRPLV